MKAIIIAKLSAQDSTIHQQKGPAWELPYIWKIWGFFSVYPH
jgi:hypothetical protein